MSQNINILALAVPCSTAGFRLIEREDVEPAAALAFSIWIGQPEIAWARKAWSVLVAAGLASYSNECERYQVFFRFLALGGIYADFSDVAWEETVDSYEYGYWAEPFDLDPLVIGQLYARHPHWSPDDDLEEYDILVSLVEAQRHTVVAALVKVFGGTSQLYASLWNSRKDRNVDDKEDEGLLSATPFEPPTWDKVAAFEWVSEGCYQRH